MAKLKGCIKCIIIALILYSFIFVFANSDEDYEVNYITPIPKFVPGKPIEIPIAIDGSDIIIIGKEVLYDSTPGTNDEVFFKTAREVYNSQAGIKFSENNLSFDEIYGKFHEIFNYTTDIDNSYRNQEYIQTVQELFRNGFRGDCDDFAMFYYVVADRKGLEVEYIVSRTHAWIRIKQGDKWVEYDSTSHTICDNCISAEYDNHMTSLSLHKL